VQTNGDQASCGQFAAVQGANGSPAYTTQLVQQLLQSCRALADVSKALQAAQSYADPSVRAHLIKELRQKQYKVITLVTEQLGSFRSMATAARDVA
jgi:hypothetical protein